MSDWYESTADPNLEQGDILPTLTALTPTMGNHEVEGEREGTISAIAEETAGIILTQTCDLAQGKVDQLLVVQVVTWSDLVATESAKGNELVNSRKFREKLIEGNIPNLSLLHETSGPPALEWSVVNFRRLYSLPVQYVTLKVQHTGERLRLRSPYREHLAQAFARYIMRVGLPHSADGFKNYSPPK